MSFIKGCVAWLAMGGVLGWSVYQAVHPKSPSLWPLLITFVALVTAIGKFGCLPPKAKH